MKVGVMASGRGSNFQAIIDAGIRNETPDVEIVQLVVNKPGVGAIQHAEKNNIPYEVIDSSKMSREEFDKKTIKIFEDKKIEVVVLAGFMRILTSVFITKYKDKIINFSNKFWNIIKFFSFNKFINFDTSRIFRN